MPFSYVSIIVGFLADLYLFGSSFTFLSIVGILLTSSGLVGKFLIEKYESAKDNQETTVKTVK